MFRNDLARLEAIDADTDYPGEIDPDLIGGSEVANIHQLQDTGQFGLLGWHVNDRTPPPAGGLFYCGGVAP